MNVEFVDIPKMASFMIPLHKLRCTIVVALNFFALSSQIGLAQVRSEMERSESGFVPNGRLVATPQQTQAISTFLRTSCIQCHSGGEAKGGILLDNLTFNFTTEADLWNSVMEQLESGSMPPRNSARPDPAQVQMVVATIRSSLGEVGALGEKDWLRVAKRLHASGKASLATDSFYAHILSLEDEAANELLKTIKWSPRRASPTVALNFAVGVELTAPDDVTDYKPIGTSQLRTDGGDGGYAPPPPPGGPNSGAEPPFHALTGDFGKALIDKVRELWRSGGMGMALVDQRGGSRPPGPPNGPTPGAGNPEFGMRMEEDSDVYPGASQPAMPPGPPPPEQRVLAPGLVYLGKGTQAELIEKAKELDVDLLFVYEVKVEVGRRTRIVTNQTRLRAITMDGDKKNVTKPLENLTVEKDKSRGVKENPTEVNVRLLFERIAPLIELTDFPPLKPEHARGRVRNLLFSDNPNKLRIMFEARLFHSLGVLTADELSTVYQIVLEGNEGIALAQGTAEDRRMVMEQFLSKEGELEQ